MQRTPKRRWSTTEDRKNPGNDPVKVRKKRAKKHHRNVQFYLEMAVIAAHGLLVGLLSRVTPAVLLLELLLLALLLLDERKGRAD